MRLWVGGGCDRGVCIYGDGVCIYVGEGGDGRVRW